MAKVTQFDKHNPAVKRVCAKVRRPLLLRWAIKETIAWILIAFSLLLSGCSGRSGGSSQYENGAYLCKGIIYSLTVTDSADLTNEEIAMRVTDDKVYFSGNSMLLGDGIKLCPIGSIEFAKKDEMYFDSAGCSMDGKMLTISADGTYNYITKKIKPLQYI